MKFLNLYKAPKSTLLALFLLVGFTVLLKFQLIDKEIYSTLSVLIVPLIFTDLLSEKKKNDA